MSKNNIDKRRSLSKASIERSKRERKKRNNRIILVCIAAFSLGYYILNYVAALEKPPIGATFNIVLGCTIIAVSLLILIYTIKRQYFPKRRKRTRHVFLDDVNNGEIKTREKTNRIVWAYGLTTVDKKLIELYNELLATTKIIQNGK